MFYLGWTNVRISTSIHSIGVRNYVSAYEHLLSATTATGKAAFSEEEIDFTYKLPFTFTGQIEKVTVELK